MRCILLDARQWLLHPLEASILKSHFVTRYIFVTYSGVKLYRDTDLLRCLAYSVTAQKSPQLCLVANS